MKKKKNNFTERKEAREAAMKLLYSIEYNNEDSQYQIENFIENDVVENFSEKNKKYISDVVEGTLSKLREIDPYIEKYSKGWAFSRIPVIDKSILRLCIYEMFYRDDIPASVSINEAVNMAKKYGHEDSGAFTNGVMGSIYKQLAEEGRIKGNK